MLDYLATKDFSICFCRRHPTTAGKKQEAGARWLVTLRLNSRIREQGILTSVSLAFFRVFSLGPQSTGFCYPCSMWVSPLQLELSANALRHMQRCVKSTEITLTTVVPLLFSSTFIVTGSWHFQEYKKDLLFKLCPSLVRILRDSA